MAGSRSRPTHRSPRGSVASTGRADSGPSVPRQNRESCNEGQARARDCADPAPANALRSPVVRPRYDREGGGPIDRRAARIQLARVQCHRSRWCCHVDIEAERLDRQMRKRTAAPRGGRAVEHRRPARRGMRANDADTIGNADGHARHRLGSLVRDGKAHRRQGAGHEELRNGNDVPRRDARRCEGRDEGADRKRSRTHVEESCRRQTWRSRRARDQVVRFMGRPARRGDG
jgi:hypothetical protein